MGETQGFERDISLELRLNNAVEGIRQKGGDAARKIGLSFPVAVGAVLATGTVQEFLRQKGLGRFFADQFPLAYTAEWILPAVVTASTLLKDGPKLIRGALEVNDVGTIRGQSAAIELSQAEFGITPEASQFLDAGGKLKKDFETDGKQALNRFVEEISEGVVAKDKTTIEAFSQMGFSKEQGFVLQRQWQEAVQKISEHGSAAAAKIVAGIGIARELAGPLLNNIYDLYHAFTGKDNDVIARAIFKLDGIFGKDYLFGRDWPLGQRGWTLPLVFTWLAVKTNGPNLFRGILQAVDVRKTRFLAAQIEVASAKASREELQDVIVDQKEDIQVQAISPGKPNAETTEAEHPYERLGFSKEEARDLANRWELAVEKIVEHGSGALEKVSLGLAVASAFNGFYQTYESSFYLFFMGIGFAGGLGWAGLKNSDLVDGVLNAVNVQREKMQRAQKTASGAKRARIETLKFLKNKRNILTRALADNDQGRKALGKLGGLFLPPPE